MEPYNRKASRKATGDTAAQRELIARIGPHDILMGRGALSAYYQGNVRFRELVSARKGEYQACKFHRTKQAIALEIYQDISSRGGRFLLKAETVLDRASIPTDDSSGPAAWVQASHHVALEKIKQALRDNEPKKEAILLTGEPDVRSNYATLSDAARVQTASVVPKSTLTTTFPQQVMMHSSHDISRSRLPPPPLPISTNAPTHSDASRLWLHLLQQPHLSEPRHSLNLVSQHLHLVDQILHRAQQPSYSVLPTRTPQATSELLELLETQNQSRCSAPVSSLLGPPQLDHDTLTAMLRRPPDQLQSSLRSTHAPNASYDPHLVNHPHIAATSALSVPERNSTGQRPPLSSAEALLPLLRQPLQDASAPQMTLVEQFRQRHLWEQLMHMSQINNNPSLSAAMTWNGTHPLQHSAEHSLTIPPDASPPVAATVNTRPMPHETPRDNLLRHATPSSNSIVNHNRQAASAQSKVSSLLLPSGASLTGDVADLDTASTTNADEKMASTNPAATQRIRIEQGQTPQPSPSDAGGDMDAAFLVALVRRYAESAASTTCSTTTEQGLGQGKGSNTNTRVSGDDKPWARRAAADTTSEDSNLSLSSSYARQPRANKRPSPNK
jgi:hypothetical protein